MPKRRRNKKFHKARKKSNQLPASLPNAGLSLKMDKTPGNSPLFDTALGERSPNLSTTPVNRYKSLNRKSLNNRTLNTTNLCNLFTEELDSKSNLNEDSETPKVSNVSILNNKKSNNVFRLYGNEVNVNPYLRQDLKRESSYGELSFFSPQLFNFKGSSTPVDKLQANIVDILKDSLCKNSSFNENVSESNLDRSQVKYSSKFKKKSSSKLDLPYSRGLQSSASLYEDKTGVYSRILARIKRYSRVSVKWSSRVVSLCSKLGVTLKNSLTSFCHGYDRNSLEDSSTCKCQEYKKELEELNVKIFHLNAKLDELKQELIRHEVNARNIAELSEALGKVQQELAQVSELRTELEKLKVQLTCNQVKEVRAAAPPPPPPPPPPPLPPVIAAPSRPKRLVKCDKQKDDSRPIISLDDILKVKLKKAAERPLRRSAQPVVSMDMLRQVKLKPARSSRRVSTPCDSDASMSSTLTTSPISSLSRLLLENSGTKVKRLQKSMRFSFEVDSRKRLYKRDRDNS